MFVTSKTDFIWPAVRTLIYFRRRIVYKIAWYKEKVPIYKLN